MDFGCKCSSLEKISIFLSLVCINALSRNTGQNVMEKEKCDFNDFADVKKTPFPFLLVTDALMRWSVTKNQSEWKQNNNER